jgi:thymidylate synthase
MNNTDKEYNRLLQTILDNGRLKKNRTGINTIAVFGEQAKFKVDLNAFPILTTKKVFTKGIIYELLWFIKGDTNIKYLVDNDVHIWDEWAYAKYKKGWGVNADVREYSTGKLISHPITQEEFIQRIKENPEFAKKWGELGEGTYGSMWRAFPAFREQVMPNRIYIDQLQKVIDKLKTNPDDRRMIVSAWHPYWVDHCALPPCHCLFHFNTEELTHEERVEIVRQRNPGVSSWDGMGGISSLDVVSNELGWLDSHFAGSPVPKRRLNLLLYQRSCDTFLGVPFNITSYSLLLAMVAHCVGMEAGTFTHTYGDLHIYENHLDQVKLQLSRDPKDLPKLWLNPEVKSLFDFKFEDIKILDYNPHPAIKGEVAV